MPYVSVPILLLLQKSLTLLVIYKLGIMTVCCRGGLHSQYGCIANWKRIHTGMGSGQWEICWNTYTIDTMCIDLFLKGKKSFRVHMDIHVQYVKNTSKQLHLFLTCTFALCLWGIPDRCYMCAHRSRKSLFAFGIWIWVLALIKDL